MNMIKLSALAMSVLLSASALANPRLQNATLSGGKKSVVTALAQIAKETFGRELTTDEKQMIAARAAQVTAAPEARVALVSDDDEVKPSAQYQKDIYVCIGAKIAVEIIAFQGLRCVSTSDGLIVNVLFNAANYRDEVPVNASLTARTWIGLNVGAAVDVGVMVINHPVNIIPGESNDDGYYYSRRKVTALSKPTDNAAGGLLSGSFLFWGAMGGYFYKGDSYVFLGAWQPGVAAELAASDIRITRQSN